MFALFIQCFDSDSCKTCIIKDKDTQMLDIPKCSIEGDKNEHIRTNDLSVSTNSKIGSSQSQSLKFTTKPCTPEQLYTSMFPSKEHFKLNIVHHSAKNVQWVQSNVQDEGKGKNRNKGSNCCVTKELRKKLLNQCF